MDTLKKTCENVNSSPQGMLGEGRGGEFRPTPLKRSGGRRRRDNDDAPELLCDCEDIPFPHSFISTPYTR